MTPTEICNAVRTLQAQARSVREISRLLKLSRNTVRRILRPPLPAAVEPLSHGITLAHLQSVFERAQGNVARVFSKSEMSLSVRRSGRLSWFV